MEIPIIPRLVAVVDTCVMLDSFWCRDLFAAYEPFKGPDGEPDFAAAFADPAARYRRVRMRESLLLAMYLDSLEATTYGLRSELTTILTKHVSPTDQTRFEN